MKNIITVIFTFLTLSTFAQNDLEGTWYGIALSEENVNRWTQVWRFEDGKLEIKQTRNSNQVRRFNYTHSSNQIMLEQEGFEHFIQIKELTDGRMTLKDTIQDLLFILQKQNVEILSQLQIDKVPALKHYRINTPNNEFSNFQLSFFHHKEQTSLIIYQDYKCLNSCFLAIENDSIEANDDELEHKEISDLEIEYDNYNHQNYKLDLFVIRFHKDNMSSILISKISEDEISGLINSSIPFTLSEIKQEPSYKKEDFKKHSFIRNMDAERMVFSKDFNKKGRIITIGKSKITFVSDTSVIISLYDEYWDSHAEPELRTYKGKWYLDDLGQNLYIRYFNNETFRKIEMVIQFQIEKEDNTLTLVRTISFDSRFYSRN